MVTVNAVIEKFKRQGEKTGWTYVLIPAEKAALIKPGFKKSYRIKGFIDNHPLKSVAMIPMGGGDFIIALNEEIRKGTRKPVGSKVILKLEADESEYQLYPALIECLEDEPEANKYFNSLAPSHRRYFSKWIESAKSETTRINRMARTINALSRKMNYGEMLREKQVK